MNSDPAPTEGRDDEKTVKNRDQTVELSQSKPSPDQDSGSSYAPQNTREETDKTEVAEPGVESLIPPAHHNAPPFPADTVISDPHRLDRVDEDRTPPGPLQIGEGQLTEQNPGETFEHQSQQPGIHELLPHQRTIRRQCAEAPLFIGRYQVIRLLGEGAFGKVFEAHDPQLDRKVAIKVAKQLSQKSQIVRFLREARAAAQLRHPNIIPVYEYGRVGQEHIIVYEFVPGETLRALMARHKPLPLEETTRIIRQIAEGLDYAHQQGIIHRDMKPENVLIDQQGRPHIADFGCARSMEDETHLTLDGSILGTPMYMSPEQASGNSKSADSRTDIWSLGVMLYEMVSGQRPFRGKVPGLLHQICNEDPQPLRKIAPEIPIDIDTICSKCVVREPDKRLQTAQLLADELERFEHGEPILSRRIGPFLRTWMWAKRNQTVAALLAIVVTTLLVGTIVSSTFAYQAYREQKNRALAQLNSLTTSEPEKLPEIFASLAPFRSSVLPQLWQKLNDQNGYQEEHRIRMAILELEQDQDVRNGIADEMVEYLLTSDAGDFSVCRMCLRFRKRDLTQRLWATALNVANENSDRRFRAAAALALYDPLSEHWLRIAPDVGGYLTSLNQIEMADWLDSLNSLSLVRHWLKPHLVSEFQSAHSNNDISQVRAAAVLSLMFTDEVDFLTTLIPATTSRQLPLIVEALRANRTKAIRQLTSTLQRLDEQSITTNEDIQCRSNVVMALIQLGDLVQWQRFDERVDPSVPTDMIERLAAASTRAELLIVQFNRWENQPPNLLASILLAMGQFEMNQLPLSQREILLPTLISVFNRHPSGRVHSCARWLLERWDFVAELESAESRLRQLAPSPDKNWHVDLAGNTFVLFGPCDEFHSGFAPDTPGTVIQIPQVFNEPLHRKRIPRRYGICIHEVTIEKFEVFENHLINRLEAELASGNDPKTARDRRKVELRINNIKRVQSRRANQSSQSPISNIDFFSALSYCRWQSERQQLDSALPTVKALDRLYEERKDFTIRQQHLDSPGYRLPTATEWEFACRQSTETVFPFGQSPEFATAYAWFASNSSANLHAVGQLKPGIGGLFDDCGNVSEWCLDWYHESPVTENDRIFVDFETDLNRQAPGREYRGGSYVDQVVDLRGTRRLSLGPSNGLDKLGFRLARTYPLPSKDRTKDE
jgi:formylglycine-generating enzyme required for sulfatase activity/tRNA A-37 threonylcarbamoyl transferase component Bud32